MTGSPAFGAPEKVMWLKLLSLRCLFFGDFVGVKALTLVVMSPEGTEGHRTCFASHINCSHELRDSSVVLIAAYCCLEESGPWNFPAQDTQCPHRWYTWVHCVLVLS